MTESLLKFPQEMPIKIIGVMGSNFESEVFKIAKHHFPNFKEEQTKLTQSSGGKYECLTIIVSINSLDHLDAFYKEIGTCPDVKFTI